MIIRLSPHQLRALADQADAYTAIAAAGGKDPDPEVALRVDGIALAYLHWHDDAQRYLVEFISFTPGDSEPLSYHPREVQ